MSLLEPVVRLLADRRRRREASIRRRRAARLEDARTREAAEAQFEAEHHAERLETAARVLHLARAFAKSPEAQWAFETYYGRWPLGARLVVGPGGVIWLLGERHWFGGVPDRQIATAEDLAASVRTKDLRRVVAHLEHPAVWQAALAMEIAHRLGIMGRP